jgi:hypothetical protein
MKDTNTPKCQMQEALVSHLYDEATADETERVKAHLNNCSSCRDVLSGFQRVRGMLQNWELEGVPMPRISTDPGPKSATLRLVKELFLALPLWTRSLGAIATAMLALAVLGTEVKIDRDGFSFRLSLLGRVERSENTQTSRAEIESLVNQLIGEKQEQQKADLLRKIAEIEQSQGSSSSDLAKLAARIREQHVKIESLERDIDRREGLSLTDLLLSGDSDRGGSSTGTGAGQ